MTVTAATMDLTTAYYIVDSSDDMLTAEELALRPVAEALINKPAEVVAGPMTMAEAWDLFYRGNNGNVSDDELDRYIEAVEMVEASEREKAEKESKKEAAAKAAAEAAAAEVEAELAAQYGDETIARVKDWFNKYDKYSSVERSSLAKGILKYFLDSGFILDAIEPSEEEALVAHVMSEESMNEDEAGDMVASGEAFAEFGKEVAPITYAAFLELEEATGLEGEEAAEVANEII